MRPHPHHVVGVIVWALISFVNSAGAGEEPAGTPELTRFQEAVGTYVALHRDLERHIPPPEISSDARKIQQSVDAMAAAIQAARRSARTGDIFDAATGVVLRTRIDAALLARGHDAADLLAAAADHDDAAIPRPAVNGRFSWALNSFMVPCVLEALPPLPPELEYRFVDRDLVLLDVDANLVVDILAGALPPPSVPLSDSITAQIQPPPSASFPWPGF